METEQNTGIGANQEKRCRRDSSVSQHDSRTIDAAYAMQELSGRNFSGKNLESADEDRADLVKIKKTMKCNSMPSEKLSGMIGNNSGRNFMKATDEKHQFLHCTSQMNCQIIPNRLDVLCGRGAGITNFEGNINFRKLISSCKLAYIQATAPQKKKIILHIVDTIAGKTGRFLRRNPKTGLWQCLSFEDAKKKTGQALREDAPILKKVESINNDNDDKRSLEQCEIVTGYENQITTSFCNSPVLTNTQSPRKTSPSTRYLGPQVITQDYEPSRDRVIEQNYSMHYCQERFLNTPQQLSHPLSMNNLILSLPFHEEYQRRGLMPPKYSYQTKSFQSPIQSPAKRTRHSHHTIENATPDFANAHHS